MNKLIENFPITHDTPVHHTRHQTHTFAYIFTFPFSAFIEI